MESAGQSGVGTLAVRAPFLVLPSRRAAKGTRCGASPVATSALASIAEGSQSFVSPHSRRVPSLRFSPLGRAPAASLLLKGLLPLVRISRRSIHDPDLPGRAAEAFGQHWVTCRHVTAYPIVSAVGSGSGQTLPDQQTAEPGQAQEFEALPGDGRSTSSSHSFAKAHQSAVISSPTPQPIF